MIDLDYTILVQAALFFVAFFVLRSLVFRPMVAVFEERDRSIEGARRDVKLMEREASKNRKTLEAQMDKVRVQAAEERDRLRAEGKHLETRILDEVRAETQKQLVEADSQIAYEAQKIRGEIKATVPSLAKEIAGKLIEREV